jgi:hypothetical protein
LKEDNQLGTQESMNPEIEMAKQQTEVALTQMRLNELAADARQQQVILETIVWPLKIYEIYFLAGLSKALFLRS